MTLPRRRFLGLAGAAGVAAVTGGSAWAALLRDRATTAAGTDPAAGPARAAPDPAAAGRVLVVVQLSGGNDAVNTVVPTDPAYHDLRPTLALPDDQLVALPGLADHGLHPALAPLLPLWQAGRVAAVPGAGFATNGRSHFASLDTWWTANPDHRLRTGWVGRWLDATGAADDHPLAAIALGGGPQPALRAERSLATAIADVDGFRLRAPAGSDPRAVVDALLATAAPAGATTPSGTGLASEADALALARAALPPAERAVALVEGVHRDGGGDEGGGGDLAAGLATAADLLALDLGTRVVLVGAGGYDTHAGQADRHADLLADLGSAVARFFATLEARGQHEKVLLVTTSEFGRRAAENGSGGTDHGLAGTQLVVGPGVRGGMHGAVDLRDLVDGDLRATTDARVLHAAALDWLGGPTDEVLAGRFPHQLLA